jgi:hypothetical protein
VPVEWLVAVFLSLVHTAGDEGRLNPSIAAAALEATVLGALAKPA